MKTGACPKYCMTPNGSRPNWAALSHDIGEKFALPLKGGLSGRDSMQ
jgi:hypothetical protein